MRITCTATERGNVFCFYRTDDRFCIDLKPLIPILLACQGDVLVGEEDSDPSLLLTAGPLGADAEGELLRRARRHLAPGCPHVPRLQVATEHGAEKGLSRRDQAAVRHRMPDALDAMPKCQAAATD